MHNGVDSVATHLLHYVRNHRRPYKHSKYSLWLEAKKPVEEGGWPALHKENGGLIMRRTAFESLIPCSYRKFTSTQMKLCKCLDCENAKLIHEDKMAWNLLNARALQTQVRETTEGEDEESLNCG